MSQKGKNGSIFSFFKPIPRPQGTADPPRPSTPTRSPTPLPPSSPFSRKGTPSRAKTPLRRDFEVKDSDDEGPSSDDSLEDLSAILGRHGPSRAIPLPSHQRQNLLTTPKAKRTAVEFHSSPLAIIPKHKFDLKALAKDAEKDDATHASSMRVKGAAKDEDEASDVEMSQDAFEDIVKGKGGHDAQKVLRAVQRTQSRHCTLRYHFFEQGFHPPRSTPPPKEFEKGPWRVLTQGGISAREQHLASGLPLTLLQMQGGLPDDLFIWVLDELCVQKSSLVRLEYCNLLSFYREPRTGQIERMLTPERLEESFQRLGASDELRQRDVAVTLSKSSQEPYERRDWGNLKSFLTLLRRTISEMSLPSITYAAHALLRMSLDTAVMHNIDVLVEYEDTIQTLLAAIPRPSWDSFCFDACSDLHRIMQPQSLRINVLACLPVSTAEVHDLRRRLAVAFLYDDPSLGKHHPNNTITMKGLIHRMGEEDFTVGPDTDFAELRARILLLNIAIDDGSFVVTDDPDDEKVFNEDVDELALLLRGIWRKINDAGMKLARTETKAVIEWVQQRLSHSVRTRRKAKSSVFDMGGKKDDPFLPRQQDYMKNFLKKPSRMSTPMVSETSSPRR